MDFDAIMTRISAMAQAGVAKAKDLAEIAKLKMSNSKEKDGIRKAYTEIGKLYFAQRGTDPDPAFASLCAEIGERMERIAENDQTITDIKLAKGISDEDIEAMESDTPLRDAMENMAVGAAEKVATAVESVEGVVGDAVEVSLQDPIE